MSEESPDQCVVCLEDVREKGDFFGILKCCNHIYCFQCIRQWDQQFVTEELPGNCPYCRRDLESYVPSLIRLKVSSHERKKEFMQFCADHTDEITKWAHRMMKNGMKLEKCAFNCGFAEVMKDGSLMCPHGLYDERRHDEEQRKHVDLAVQKIADEKKMKIELSREKALIILEEQEIYEEGPRIYSQRQQTMREKLWEQKRYLIQKQRAL